MGTFKKYGKRSRALAPTSELSRRFLEKLAQMTGCPEQAVLVELWRNWPVVMGEEIAAFCLPLGHRDHRLEVGCEDSMAMQELQYYRQEIMERANSFMEEAYFTDIKVELVLNQKPLWADEAPEVSQPARPLGNAVGTYLKDMDPDSPIARCYRAYCRRSGRADEAGQNGQPLE